MDQTDQPRISPWRRPQNNAGRAVFSGSIGLGVLLAFTFAGADVRQEFHLSLPGPVIGLALLAAMVLLAERCHARPFQQLAARVVPIGRVLLSNMGALFVPAGVGIITEGAALRQQWLPIVAALVASTLVGLMATGWFMLRFARKTPVS